MLTIDGSFGEGGGQILRTALGLSLATGTPFHIEKIRAGRKTPGLLRQHLTAVQAAAEISKGDVTGASIGSRDLTFRPKPAVPGTYGFAVGTAGSATLVLQTVLPALLTAPGPSNLTLEGGTHNPWAPPFDFLAKAFLPLVERMGPRIAATLERRGFYPAGGGRFTVAIEPARALSRLDLLERGEIRSALAKAIVASLPASIARRELQVIERKLSLPGLVSRVEEDRDSTGPGNVAVIVLECERLTEVFTGFGQQGVRAETVAERLVDETRRYLSAGVPVGPHLADQLLVPMALAGGGSFRTLPLTRHSTTNIEIVRLFLGTRVAVTPEGDLAHRVEIEGGGRP